MIDAGPPLFSRSYEVDQDAGYVEVSGTWTDFGGQGFDNDISFAPTGSGGAVAEYTFTGLAAGYYQVSATWTESSNRATDAPFTILDDTTSLVTVDVNQKLEPIADAVYAGRKFQHLGEPVAISSGNLVVQLTNDANGFVIADAIHLEIVLPSDEGVAVIDDDTGYDQVSGSWSTLGTAGFNGDFDYAASGSGAAVVEYSFTDLAAGYYQVSITWVKDTNRATDSPFTILDGTTELSWSYINQTLAPEADVVEDDIDFMHLGNPLPISSGTLVVRLTNDANGYVVADAVRIERIEDPPVTFFTYDAAGQLLTKTDPLGRTWTYEYDELGRLTREISPDPATGAAGTNSPEMSYIYDAEHNVIAETDKLGNVRRFGYDNLYRRISDTDENGDATLSTFDLVGNLKTLTDPVGNETEWFYDGLNRVTQEENQLDDSRFFQYDLVGNLLEKTDRNGRVTRFDYDDLYRQTAERWLDSQQQTIHTISYEYDVAGRMLSADDANATYTYGFDMLDRATSIAQEIAGLMPTVGFLQAFDVMNNRTQIAATVGSTADFVTGYTYDNLYRMTGIEQSAQAGGNAVAEKAIDLEFDVASQLVTLTRFGDVSRTKQVADTHFTFDDAGRLTDLTHRRGIEDLTSYQWQYDTGNRLTQFTSSQDGSVDYTYDDRDQLTAADYDYQSDELYSYDENGNRTNTGYETGDVNRLEEDGTYSYEYDNEGNRARRTHNVNDTVTVYTWDDRNRLVTVTEYASTADADAEQNSTKVVDYAYDAFNRWIGRTVDPDGDGGSATIQETFFVYDGKQIVLQFDGDEAADLAHRYLWGPMVDQILADEVMTDLEEEGDVLWPLTDNLGTVRGLAEYDGQDTTIVDHYVYDAFGNETDHTGSNDFLFKYTGRAFDEETGLQNNLNRWYDATIGRWLSEDPIGFSAGDANVYRYVGNSSTLTLDPSGLEPPVIIPDLLLVNPNYPSFPPDLSGRYKPDPAKQAVASLLNEEASVHRCYAYYQASGLKGFLDKLRTALWDHVTRVTENSGAVDPANFAHYRPIDDDIQLESSISKTNRKYLMRELVHAYNDMHDIYLGPFSHDVRGSGGLASAADHLIDATRYLRKFEDDITCGRIKSPAQAHAAWEKAWNIIEKYKQFADGKIATTTVQTPQPYPIADDYRVLSREMGFDLNFHTLARIYSQLLKKHGVDVVLRGLPWY